MTLRDFPNFPFLLKNGKELQFCAKKIPEIQQQSRQLPSFSAGTIRSQNSRFSAAFRGQTSLTSFLSETQSRGRELGRNIPVFLYIYLVFGVEGSAFRSVLENQEKLIHAFKE